MRYISVLHIDSETTWRGGENQIRLLVEGARALGVESHLAAPRSSQIMKRLGGQVPSIEFSLSVFGWFWAIFAICGYVRSNGISIIDAHSSRAHGMGLIISLLCPKVRLIVHRRVDNVPGGGLISKLKYHSPLVDRYVSISSAIRDVLVDIGVDPSRVETVYSAVPEVTFSSTEKQEARQALCCELGWDPTIPIIASIGYLTKQKGHSTLLGGLKLLKNKNIRFQCFIAGDGELRNELEQEALELGLGADDLVFLGIRNDIRRLMLSSDILSMPSNNEGLGTTILDAMQFGLAVAASEVGGIVEIISDGENGLLSKVGDAVSHGEKIARFILEKADRELISSNGQSSVRERFSVELMVLGNVEIYRKALSAKYINID